MDGVDLIQPNKKKTLLEHRPIETTLKKSSRANYIFSLLDLIESELIKIEATDACFVYLTDSERFKISHLFKACRKLFRSTMAVVVAGAEFLLTPYVSCIYFFFCVVVAKRKKITSLRPIHID